MIKQLLKRNTNLDFYLDKKTEELYHLERRYFTNYNIKVEVSEEDNKIVARSYVNYTDNGRTEKDVKISAYYDKPQDQVNKIIILDPNDKSRFREFKEDQINIEQSKEYGVFENEFFINVPEEFLLESLEIHKETVTVGNDHWIDVGTIFARPTQGVQINVLLKDNLMIKDEFITGDSKQYHISKTENSYTFTSADWISSYCGICLLIAKKK